MVEQQSKQRSQPGACLDAGTIPDVACRSAEREGGFQRSEGWPDRQAVKANIKCAIECRWSSTRIWRMKRPMNSHAGGAIDHRTLSASEHGKVTASRPDMTARGRLASRRKCVTRQAAARHMCDHLDRAERADQAGRKRSYRRRLWLVTKRSAFRPCRRGRSGLLSAKGHCRQRGRLRPCWRGDRHGAGIRVEALSPRSADCNRLSCLGACMAIRRTGY